MNHPYNARQAFHWRSLESVTRWLTTARENVNEHATECLTCYMGHPCSIMKSLTATYEHAKARRNEYVKPEEK